MRFDLTDLRLFLSIADAGSITHGAAAAHMSLAAASERLIGMEADAGVRLVDRGRRGVALTAAGETLAHHARLVLKQMGHLVGEIGEHAAGRRGAIRVLANTASMTEILPERLARFLELHPHVDLDLKERTSSEIVKAVAGGLADVGVVSDAVDTRDVAIRPFATDRLVVAVAGNSNLSTKRKVAFSDLLKVPFVGLAVGSGLQDHIDEHALRAGQPLSYRLRVVSVEASCLLAARGIGIAIVPEAAARRCRRHMGFGLLRLSDLWARRQLLLCTEKGRTPPPLVRTFLDAMVPPAVGDDPADGTLASTKAFGFKQTSHGRSNP
ncbi:LysR substrate-binding domain-containing protein [Xanthobacter variabilis]|uniref:LysR substrate-binding domain-containing protein n=1 Tax=Xanthobacter variabilis TaxID=3119932 RepID=UPI00374F3D7B